MGRHYSTIVLAGSFLVLLAVCILLFVQHTKQPAIVGVVVPHHDLVAPVRQSYLKQVAALFQPSTIVLVAPNHFDSGSASILTSTSSWVTSVGVLEADTVLITSTEVPVNHRALDGDHSVTGLLRDLKYYFPHAKIAPFMFRRDATYDEVKILVDSLSSSCRDCLVVASVDFSHTESAVLSSLHDEFTLRALNHANVTSLYNLAEVDSPESLAFLAMWAHIKGSTNFSLFSHTNSGYMTSTQYGEVTSHIIGGYGEGLLSIPHINSGKSLTFMIGGDAMFSRDVSEMHKARPYTAITQSLGERFFWGVDASIVNLEGVFTTTDDTSLIDAFPPKLIFPQSFVHALRYARIQGVAHANNHAGDGDRSETEHIVTNHDIAYVSGNSVMTREVGELKVAFISGSQLPPLVSIISVIEAYSQRGYKTVAYVHFGSEYEEVPNESQISKAKALIDAGADLVVGSHPHVVQPVGVYNGVPIVYSLGNFLFDQNFSIEVTEGLVLGGMFTESSVELFLLPINNYLKPSLDVRDISMMTTEWDGYIHPTKQWWYRFPLTNQLE